ncbi:hypothetical protein [Arthrobacter caoxuetaonis]|uniref:Uncharacterized protein n=1 Tax=Arthrobacter caoxuetaonis TaxID=2886935 RepID=A0A9X1MH94_9MICC|nr:hypothetical protein [Arthrobacter caoxuetaonis]MCC3299327.1 hypothetical protein [Arthrobacter caoxuetaonis]USQ59180.1 hypothetical protein NF551_18915 [Arthrobacter caoxuetaonis]
MNTLHNRRPEGTPEGGQFAPSNHPEATGVALANPADRPITIAPGEDEIYPELADGEVIERLTVSRDEDDPDKYLVCPSRAVNFHALVEHYQPDLTEDQREEWLTRYQPAITDFMATRYGVDLSGDRWDSIDAECTLAINDPNPTEDKISDAAWNQTRIVNLANEEDPGTFGSENLSRLLYEHVEATACVESFHASKPESERMGTEEVDRIIEARLGQRELPDAAALRIAYDMGMSGPYPVLAKFARTGLGSKDEIRGDLRKIYERDQYSPKASRRVDMMFTYLEHGGDNK